MSDDLKNQPLTHATQYRFTGKHMLALMIVFFFVIISVNFFMASLASKTWTGLVVKNSYVASQEFNANLEKAAIQKARGWSSIIKYENNILKFSLIDSKGNLLIPSVVNLKVGRPAYEQEDKSYIFSNMQTHAGNINLNLARGDWDLIFLTNFEGDDYRRDVRLFVDEYGKGVVQ